MVTQDRKLHLLLKGKGATTHGGGPGATGAKRAALGCLQLQQAWRHQAMTAGVREAREQWRDPPTATPRDGVGGEPIELLFLRESVLCPELCA